MAKGGHAASGRPPDPDALRRDRGSDAAWTTLEGERSGVPPAWPFGEPSDAEREVWVREWRRPQAVMWERNGQVDEVALYVRALLEAAERGASTASRTLVRQQQEALGISLPGLLRNRWRILGADTKAKGSARPRARSGLRVVSGGSG